MEFASGHHVQCICNSIKYVVVLCLLQQMELAKCAVEVRECRKELMQTEHSYAQMQLFTAQIEDDLQQLTLTLDEDQECMDAHCLSR